MSVSDKDFVRKLHSQYYTVNDIAKKVGLTSWKVRCKMSELGLRPHQRESVISRKMRMEGMKRVLSRGRLHQGKYEMTLEEIAEVDGVPVQQVQQELVSGMAKVMIYILGTDMLNDVVNQTPPTLQPWETCYSHKMPEGTEQEMMNLELRDTSGGG